jgi:hypothetical protein
MPIRRSGVANAITTPEPVESGFYTTNFDGTEDPLSEDGVWLNAGGSVAQYWQSMRKSGGVAYGAGPTDEYEDCVSIISPGVIPFGADHVIRAMFHIAGGYSAPDFTHECQLLFQLGASKPVILKWKGAGGGGFFAQLTNTSESELGFQDGDIAIAQITTVGDDALIEVFRDRGGTVLPWAATTDTGAVSGDPIATGQPGVVQFTRPDADMVIDSFAWDSWTASDDPGDFE